MTTAATSEPDAIPGFGRTDDSPTNLAHQELTRVESASPATVGRPLATTTVASTLTLFERLAANPAIDVDKFERLMKMQMELIAFQARADFAAAKAQMQPHIPAVLKRGKITVDDKDGRKGRSTPYAKFEDIVEAIRPILGRFGFDLAHRTKWLDGGKMEIIGKLLHEGGHFEEDSFVTVSDTSGGKNAIQGLGSAESYGRRYTTKNLLLIAEKGEDDNGKGAGKAEAATKDDAPQASTRKSARSPAPSSAAVPGPSGGTQVTQVAPAATATVVPHPNSERLGKIESLTAHGAALIVKLTTGYRCTTRDAEIIKALRRHEENAAVIEVSCRASSDPSKFLPIIEEIVEQRVHGVA